MNMDLLFAMDYQNPEATGLAEPAHQFASSREAARAVVQDDTGAVYLISATAKGGYYKLPGGGVEAGESITEALHREIREELGYEIEIVQPVGRAVQYDESSDFRQGSYCYLARITGGSGQPDLSESEQQGGVITVRFDTIDSAIENAAAVEVKPEYRAMAIRDLRLLKAAAALLKGPGAQ